MIKCDMCKDLIIGTISYYYGKRYCQKCSKIAKNGTMLYSWEKYKEWLKK